MTITQSRPIPFTFWQFFCRNFTFWRWEHQNKLLAIVNVFIKYAFCYWYELLYHYISVVLNFARLSCTTAQAVNYILYIIFKQYWVQAQNRLHSRSFNAKTCWLKPVLKLFVFKCILEIYRKGKLKQTITCSWQQSWAIIIVIN